MNVLLAIAMAAERGEQVLLLQMEFSGGTVFLSSASQPIEYNGNAYLGIGGAFTFSNLTESADLSGNGLEVKVSGVNQGVMALILEQHYIGYPVSLSVAAFDDDGTIIGDALALFQGYMNGGWTIEEERPEQGGGAVTITGRFTDRLSMLNERRGIQANTGSHGIWSPGDIFFSLTGQLQTQHITALTWNTAPAK
jgi:hypothetical protein